ncbi:SPOC domain-like protein [Microthyrium microscopicum]|uniref:ATP-dependent DNA helicase II subunit 2 n=1 Tax=Microthyrium microscopicum TaxID=703497 RepID=A0A6A6UA91_9PEZI|nr:SPOC domain-like protein [Microthyrium microscopicum]
MANKEATVFIVDLGSSMGKKHNGRTQTDLEWSLPVVWDRIANIIHQGRKTDQTAVIGFRTNSTNNVLASNHPDTDDYDHINVAFPLKTILGSDIADLREFFRPSQIEAGDILSAIVVAMQMITVHCRALKYKKRIVLLTNGDGAMEPDTGNDIQKQLVKEDILLSILGVDFNDFHGGFQEENKAPQKKLNEEQLCNLVLEASGTMTPVYKAVSELGIPSHRTVRAVTTYKGTLTIGHIGKFEEQSMKIEIQQWPLIMPATAQSAKTFLVQREDKEGEHAGGSAESSATLQQSAPKEGEETLLPSKRTYGKQIEDPTAPGGKIDVDKEQLEKGYVYGRTAVHIGTDDMGVVNLDTEAGLEVVGFVARDKFDRYLEMSKCSLIAALAGNEKYAMALSSFIHGLIETEQFAVARFVKKDNTPPHLVLLTPFTEDGYEALITSELPFAEDMRSYKFPPLDKVVTVGGKNLAQHRTLPSDVLMKSMSNYIDAMDLSSFGTTDTGDATEYAKMEDIYNPVVNRITQVIRYRAINPLDPIPEPYEVLTKYSKPPSALLESAESALNAVKKAGDVKKVPPRQFKRKREPEKPLSGLDIDALLSGEKRQRIDPANAIPEFKQMLEKASDVAAIEDAAKQLARIIETTIRDSVGDMGYQRAVEALGTLREELQEIEEPDIYNALAQELKTKILNGTLGGERTEMWYNIKIRKLGLLDSSVSERSKVSPEAAKDYYKVKPNA